MASLLERLNIQAPAAGPIRSKQARSSSAPYNRADRSKGDVNSTWTHDLFEDTATVSLSDRITSAPVAGPTRPHVDSTIAMRALREATANSNSSTGEQPLSIKGASMSQGNVVEVTGLVRGTTAEDVCTIFKRCGVITTAKSVPSPSGFADSVTVRITFKNASSAAAAVDKFDKQAADGKTLRVRVVGSASGGTTLGGRLGGSDGLGIVRQEGSVDVLMRNSETTSKMRSDSLIDHPRAHVLIR